MKTVLIVDDEKNIRQTLSDVLEDEAYQTLAVADGKSAIEILGREHVDLVLLDIWLPEIGGIDVLKNIQEEYSNVIVVMISGHGTVDLAVEAIKSGAFDFVEKPLSIDRVLQVLDRAFKMKKLEAENATLRTTVQQKFDLIGESPAFKGIKDIVTNTADSTGRVLIFGENGTGKEMIARNIHILSDRKKEPFVEVNCAAIPENLIESELFGHEKGAFTGAVDSRKGKFELADRGTIFLDEVADMSLVTQAKVLRVLQEMEFERVGGVDTIRVDVRVIAATNKDLRAEIGEGNFREDLFYRLNVIPITVPPLRNRKEDIMPLIDYYLDYFARVNNKLQKTFTRKAYSVFEAYSWPGNVRELRNMVERICIMIRKDTIAREDILSFFTESSGVGSRSEDREYATLKEARDDFEREYIRSKLLENNMNVSKTAQVLGIERSNLHRKINNLGITMLRDIVD